MRWVCGPGPGRLSRSESSRNTGSRRRLCRGTGSPPRTPGRLADGTRPERRGWDRDEWACSAAQAGRNGPRPADADRPPRGNRAAIRACLSPPAIVPIGQLPGSLDILFPAARRSTAGSMKSRRWENPQYERTRGCRDLGSPGHAGNRWVSPAQTILTHRPDRTYGAIRKYLALQRPPGNHMYGQGRTGPVRRR